MVKKKVFGLFVDLLDLTKCFRHFTYVFYNWYGTGLIPILMQLFVRFGH